MNPLMRLTGFTQGSVASGPTSFASFLRTQAKLVQAVVDDLIPAPIGWNNIEGDEVTLRNNSAQVGGINDSVGFRVTWYPTRARLYAKTLAYDPALNDVTVNPSGWKELVNGEVVFVANNIFLGFATIDADIGVQVRNADDGNTLLAEFYYETFG
jgi:hypothetical protein